MFILEFFYPPMADTSTRNYLTFKLNSLEGKILFPTEVEKEKLLDISTKLYRISERK